MKIDDSFLVVVFIGSLAISGCSQNTTSKIGANKDSFAGSTPCNPAVNMRLNIAASDTCVFMKWVLDLFHEKGKDSLFTLSISYGDYQPNTMYFLGGGKSITKNGKLSTSTIIKNNSPYKILHLSGTKNEPALLFIQFDHNILHLVDSTMKLIKGNESQAFVLNKIDPLQKN